jgi:hypothetical protein
MMEGTGAGELEIMGYRKSSAVSTRMAGPVNAKTSNP